jgi:ActR/RegA family two-component response regulator
MLLKDTNLCKKTGTSIASIFYVHSMKTLDQIRLEHILQVLDHTGWNIKKTSEILKVSEKTIKKEIQILQNAAPTRTSKTRK